MIKQKQPRRVTQRCMSVCLVLAHPAVPWFVLSASANWFSCDALLELQQPLNISHLSNHQRVPYTTTDGVNVIFAANRFAAVVLNFAKSYSTRAALPSRLDECAACARLPTNPRRRRTFVKKEKHIHAVVVVVANATFMLSKPAPLPHARARVGALRCIASWPSI